MPAPSPATAPVITDLEQLIALRRQLVVQVNALQDRITAVDGALGRVLLERARDAVPASPAAVPVPRRAPVPSPSEQRPEPEPVPTSAQASRELPPAAPPGPGSLREQCDRILVPLLERTGEPMRARDLHAAAIAAGVRAMSSGAFSGNVLQSDTYRRVGRGLYALARVECDAAADQAPTGSPT